MVQTVKAVLDGRLAPVDGAIAVSAQQEQLVGLLRHDRDSVTRSESAAVASQLRLLAEQVSDTASADPDNDAHLAIARVLGELARALG